MTTENAADSFESVQALLTGASSAPASETPAAKPVEGAAATEEADASAEAKAKPGPATDDKAEKKDPADPAAENTEEAAKPKKPSFQERMDELTRARREAERERDEYRSQLDAVLAAKAAAGEDISDIDDAYIDQLVEERMVKREEARKAEAANAAFQDRMAAAAEKHPDFFEKVIEGANAATPTWACTPDMLAAIRESEVGADVAYHLATNPEEARRIAGLSPLSQAREIGRLEARFEAEAKAAATTDPATITETKPKAKTVTTAPEPAPQVRGASGQFKVAPDTDDFAAFQAQYPIPG